MLPSLFTSTLMRFTPRLPVLVFAAKWTACLTLMVALASFSPEVAFISTISSPASCGSEASIRVLADVPGDILCLPAHLFSKSKIDLIVPPLFAAVVVAGSAFFVRAIGLWEADEAN